MDHENFDMDNPGPPLRIHDGSERPANEQFFANGQLDGILKVKVAPDLLSMRWTWKFDKVPVPDAGSTLGLLALALGGLGFFRRREYSIKGVIE